MDNLCIIDLQYMTKAFKDKFFKVDLDDTSKELIARFFSILLTALISALITFLQSILAEPAVTQTLQENVPQAGATGAVLRAIVLYWPNRDNIRG